MAMGTTISRAVGTFVLSAAFVASSGLAQTATPSVVSMDVLRHPMSAKVRQQLLSAMKKVDAGEPEAAIGQLRETLAKYPDSAPYVQDLLGVAYVKTDRY